MSIPDDLPAPPSPFAAGFKPPAPGAVPPKPARAARPLPPVPETSPGADRPAPPAPPDPLDELFEAAAATPPPRPDDAGGADDPKTIAKRRRETCPVTCLGHREGVYYFISQAGERRQLTHRDMNESGLTDLFGGYDRWLRAEWPKWSNEKPARVIGFVFQAARAWLMRACVDAGLFTWRDNLRGPGSWKDGKGRLILHLGDEVWICDADDAGAPRVERVAPGSRIDGIYYLASPAEPKPAPLDEAATAGEMAGLLKLLGLWNFRSPHEAPRVALGWLVAAFYTGALPWHPHIWPVGETASGKSTLERLIMALLGSSAIKSADPSSAYIRQKLQNSARGVILDEIEASEMHRRSKDLVDLARLASTVDQGGTGRGSASHVAVEFPLIACIYFTSILHPPFRPQDMSRITVMRLDPLKPDPSGENQRKVMDHLDGAAAFGPRLRARLVAAWPRFEETRKIYQRAIAGLGRGTRLADQFGTLLACAHVALHDTVPTQEEVDAFAAQFDTGEFDEAASRGSEADECISRLFTSAAQSWRDGRRRVLSEIIGLVLSGTGGDEAHKALQAYGMRLESTFDAGDGAKVDGPWLVVAYDHEGLNEIFKGTRWEGGGWGQALGYFRTTVGEGPTAVQYAAKPNRRGVRMSGVMKKGIWVPLAPLLEPVAADSSEPPPSPDARPMKWGTDEDIAKWSRIPVDRAKREIAELIAAGKLERDPGGFVDLFEFQRARAVAQ